ncbi:hypothetical protein ES332_D01G166200v1 [Gossypium tomentosum]|uniref:Uncharacterized protein n=1 Tax=Gossypium tomentosum TaxID=34277 RepID=A0A5D2M9W3_GOSTO|nr:hypothetical protein ES332_D01G166200v1 [Gossypium tomentosum]
MYCCFPRTHMLTIFSTLDVYLFAKPSNPPLEAHVSQTYNLKRYALLIRPP